jgi:AcrR family transcriptional regulator
MARRALKPSADRILSAAEALFATNGYGDVSLRQLMAAAGVSTTAFYARFDSKESVLNALAERLFTDLHTEAAAVLTKQVASFDEGVERGVDILVSQFKTRKALVRLVIAEAGSIVQTIDIRRKSYTMLVGFLAHYLRALTARGRLDVKDPEGMCWALVGALELQVVRWAVWDDIDIDQLRAKLLDVARAILPRERAR